MRNYVFGYGSLICPESAALTLRRKISDKDIILAEIKGYTRLWGLVAQVILQSNEREEYINAAFLDVQKSKDKSLNGVLIEVNESELDNLDIRETQYTRTDVTDHLSPKLPNSYKVFAYIGKPELSAKHYDNVKVLAKYQKIIYNCIQRWGSEFYQRFNITTEPYNYEIVDGSYRFFDKKQNLLTGHNP